MPKTTLLYFHFNTDDETLQKLYNNYYEARKELETYLYKERLDVDIKKTEEVE